MATSFLVQNATRVAASYSVSSSLELRVTVEIRELLFKIAQSVPDTFHRGLFQQTGCRT